MVSVVTKSRVGFSVAVVALITIGGSALLWYVEASDHLVMAACAAFAVAGLFSWAKGRHRVEEVQEWTQGERTGEEEGGEGNTMDFVKRYTYWGMMLILSASLLYVTAAFFHKAPKPKPVLPRARPRAPEPQPAKPAVTFPALKLQGLDVNGSKSLAVIDGVSVGLGENLGPVKLVEVGRDYVKVAIDDEIRVLLLK